MLVEVRHNDGDQLVGIATCSVWPVRGRGKPLGHERLVMVGAQLGRRRRTIEGVASEPGLTCVRISLFVSVRRGALRAQPPMLECAATVSRTLASAESRYPSATSLATAASHFFTKSAWVG